MSQFILLNDVRMNYGSLKAGRLVSDADYDVKAIEAAGGGLVPYLENTVGPVIDRYQKGREHHNVDESALFPQLYIATRVQCGVNLSTPQVLSCPDGEWVIVRPYDSEGLVFNGEADLDVGEIHCLGMAPALATAVFVVGGPNNEMLGVGIFRNGEQVEGGYIELELQRTGRPFPFTLSVPTLAMPGEEYDVRVKWIGGGGGSINVTMFGGVFFLAS